MLNKPSHSDVALSSRVRLARNFASIPFPPMMTEAHADEVYRLAAEAIRPDHEYLVCRLREMPPPERVRLVERHRISPDLLKKPETAAVLLRKDDAVCVMVNEEDHLRIQAILPGLDLNRCAELAAEIDDRIESHSDFAFDLSLGYLTACPTNTGTGLRGSVMLHLPALTLIGQINPIAQAVAKIGLTVRGIYGEGTEAAGCLYQLSNQVTLGRTEEDILTSLRATAAQVIETEREARANLMKHNPLDLEDRLLRSFGLFTHARRMNSKEFMKLWSDVRLAADLALIPIPTSTFDPLVQDVQPASLAARAGKELNAHERDALRCTLIRERIAGNEGGAGNDERGVGNDEGPPAATF